jgi:RNA polymerase sigma-70 factor (ECF subfamily)
MHDAEDILFEVFLAALEHEADLVELAEDQQRAWLWTVARNRLIDAYRRKKRRPDVPLESITEMIDQAHTPEQAALRGEEDEQVRRWIRTLPPQQQEVLTMRFTGEMRCAEIAAILQKNEGAVRTMLSRALNALRGLYHEEQRGAEQ